MVDIPLFDVINYNPFSLSGKTLLAVGASSGIGRQVAIECSKLGASVHIVARTESALKQTLSLMAGDTHVIHVCDITDGKQLDNLIEELPKLDGMCNSVGVSKVMLVKFLNKHILDEMMNTNALSPILLTQRLAKNKKFNNQASIVFISSLSGVYTVHYGDALNAATKAAVNGFAKSAALDLSAQGIRVNCVNPGIVATQAAFAGTILTQEEMNEKQQFFPLKRFGKPEDVALAVTFLLSDASTWITGTCLPVDGGYTLL